MSKSKQQSSSKQKSAPPIALRTYFFILLQKEEPAIMEELAGDPLTYYCRVLDSDEEAEIKYTNSLNQWACKHNLGTKRSVKNIPENQVHPEIIEKCKKKNLDWRENKIIVLIDGTKIRDREIMAARWCVEFADQYVQFLESGKKGIFVPDLPVYVNSIVWAGLERMEQLLSKISIQPENPVLIEYKHRLEERIYEDLPLLSSAPPDEWKLKKNSPTVIRDLRWTIKSVLHRMNEEKIAKETTNEIAKEIADIILADDTDAIDDRTIAEIVGRKWNLKSKITSTVIRDLKLAIKPLLRGRTYKEVAEKVIKEIAEKLSAEESYIIDLQTINKAIERKRKLLGLPREPGKPKA